MNKFDGEHEIQKEDLRLRKLIEYLKILIIDSLY